MSVCKQQWTEALLFTCELVTPVVFYISTTQAGSREEEKKKREREVGFQRLCRLKWICYLGIYLFKNIIESVIYTLSIFQGFNRILSKSFIQIVNFGLK